MSLPRDVAVAFWVTGELGGEFTVIVPQAGPATLRDGIASDYDLGFEVSAQFLATLDRGEMNALTAMGQARSADPTPLTPRFGPRFSSIPDSGVFFRRFAFHFWNRSVPESVRFGEGTTRELHGGEAAVLYYDNQFRSAWYQLNSGMHINAEPSMQRNNYPQMVIVTRGRFRGRINGVERPVVEGEMLFIPAGVPSEFWAESGESGEFVWLGFGPGA
jgi:hypothetical protein